MTAMMKILLVALSILFLTLQSLDYMFYAFGVKALMLIGLLTLYLRTVKKKRLWFGMFLGFFTLSELLNFIFFNSEYFINDVEILFVIINIIYILSFVFLGISILRKLNFREILKCYKLHLIVLLVMDIFCVLTVTNTTAENFDVLEYAVIFMYYAVIMTVMSISFINFLYWDDQKSMLFMLGTVFIVFSEVVQITYYFIADMMFLAILWSVLLIFAFLLFFLQAGMERGPKLVDYEKLDYGEIGTKSTS